MSEPDINMINGLFLELSQFATATTAKELALIHKCERLICALSYLAELGGGNSEGNYFAKAALKKEQP